LSKLLIDGAVSLTQTGSPRCTVTLRRCISNENKRGSAVELAMRRPSSWRKSNAHSTTAPRDSTAMGVKSYRVEADCCTLTSFFFLSSFSFLTSFNAHGHPEAWTRGHLPSPEMLRSALSLQMLSKTVDEAFMHHFEKMSSASAGFASRSPPGSCPWTMLGDFHPHCLTMEKILRTPTTTNNEDTVDGAEKVIAEFTQFNAEQHHVAADLVTEVTWTLLSSIVTISKLPN